MKEIFLNAALVGDVWILWILVMASIISVAVMIERSLVFSKEKINFPDFLDNLDKFLKNRDFEGALAYSKKHSSLEARVVAAGLEVYELGPGSVEEAMNSRLVRERNNMEKGLVILGTLGNNAPFIGLFGTVLGIIKAFNDLALSGSSGVSVVMAGISSALVATALGILVAIPAVAANNIFYSKIKRKTENAKSTLHLIQSYLQDLRCKKNLANKREGA